jgi:hypothetical protein
MAINVSFNGATIYKPGAYSQVEIDLGGGFPLSPTGIIALFGEADAGAPGSAEPNLANNVFGPDQYNQILAKYGSGNIVDACNFLFAPGADGAIPGGAQAVYIYKTNASTQATLDPIAAGATPFGMLQSQAYGVGGNLVTFKNTITPEGQAVLTSAVITFPVVVTTGTNDTLAYSLNGGAPATATVAADSYASAAALATALNTALGANTMVAAAGTVANTITLTQAIASNPQRNGYGRSMQLGSGNISTSIGLSSNAFAAAASEPMATLVVANPVSTLTESATVGGDIPLSIGRSATGGVTAASVTIGATAITLTQTGATPASYSLPIANFPSIQSVASFINTLSGWSASVESVQIGLQPITVLDQVSAVGALYSGATAQQPARIKMDASEVVGFFAASTQVNLVPSVSASQTAVKTVGLPDQQGVPNALYLTGGVLGATASADIVNALSKFEKFRVNAVVPLFSRDASQDILDEVTDPSSTYTIAAVHQAVKTHCSLMATTKKKSERQGYLSMKDTYANCKSEIATTADARQQMVIQDIRQADSAGNIQWFQPWAGACLLAGARGGSPVGNPMTFKYFNMSGIRQTGQLLSTAEQNIVIDFDPDVAYDDAIQNGVTFWEAPQTGGFRLVVDNTTYGKDGNWVYNRAHVLYASDVLAYDFRNQLENIYIGLKNTVNAVEVQSTCAAILATYLAQGITVSTSDAKNGYKALVVQINGNTINVSVTVKLVEGIDFILANITLQRASSST